MQLEKYSFEKIGESHTYQFFSTGPQGKVKKVVCIDCESWRPIPFFILSFGDWDEKKRALDDRVVTNNDDRRKVLSTVSAVLLKFIEDKPGCWIYAKGSTPSRTRLYQMGISSVWDEIKYHLTVYGEIKGKWIDFVRGINFDSFLLKSK